MLFYIVFSVFCVLLVYFLYMYKKIHYHFDKAGLKYLPGVPIFGNVLKSTFLRRHFIYDLEEVYNAFPDERYVGFADGMVPVILVRDPELMKIITIKDFDHFQNRKQYFPVRLDPLLGRNLVQLKDEEWKVTRIQLTPAFTAARLRYMLPSLIEVSKRVIESLKHDAFKEICLSESMYRYAGDSLAAAAFGIDQENAGKKDSLFSKFGGFLALNFTRRVMVFIMIQFPNLGEAIKVVTDFHLFSKRASDFFRKLVSDSLKYREENNLSIPDYMDVLQKLPSGKSIDDLAGQFFFSYGASFEATSGLLKLCFHELALNPEIQDRLYQEIREHAEVGELTLESINELKYLDCVFNEINRRWSAAVVMDRVCTKTYVLPPPRDGGKPYTVRPGDTVFNVLNPVQMDPKYHPNPEVFDPDRFSDANKKNIKPFTFLPFGTGPRGCLGTRFVTLQMKVMIYQMVLNFELVKSEKTSNPILLEPDEFNMYAAGGTWLCLKPRQ